MPDGYVFEDCGQNSLVKDGNDNHWCRIAHGRTKQLLEFPDVWVEDREAYNICALTREAVRHLQRLIQASKGSVAAR